MSDTQIHDEVSKAYTEALRRSREGRGGSCCGPDVASGPSSGAAALAGYGEEREKYAEAAASSFGCGNPLAFAGEEAGQTVLDLGSGAGLDLLVAAEKVGPTGKVIGIDMTDAMIEAARAAATRAGHANIEVRKGLIEALPVEDASVDWVISNCVINLSPRKDQVFREIQRVLKPGGRLSISDIVVEDLPDWLLESAAAYTGCVAGAISEAEYLEGLRQAGLEEVEVESRLVYEPGQIRAIAETDLADLALDPKLVDRALDEAKGKIASVRFGARKPEVEAPEEEALGGTEKTLIALSAAIGGGCRTCAEHLHSVAGSLGATPEQIERAFAEGLRQRDSATRVMREKAEALLGRTVKIEAASGEAPTRLELLGRLAASTASNSAPDALRHVAAARAAGATEAQIQVAIGIARTVRSKAQGFSDAELGDSPAEDAGCGCG
jgi:SAM-dependent methyltransferase